MKAMKRPRKPETILRELIRFLEPLMTCDGGGACRYGHRARDRDCPRTIYKHLTGELRAALKKGRTR